MATYAFPTNIVPNESEYELLTNTQAFTSPHTGSVQTSERKGSRWRIRLTFENLSDVERGQLQAFITRLNGQQHRFTYSDHSYSLLGAGGSATVSGGGQTGPSLDVTASGLGLEPGDWIAVSGQLKMVTTAVSGTGARTITISPPLHNSPADGAGLSIGDSPAPSGTFILASTPRWTNVPGVFSSFTLEGIEDVLV